jgi:putative endonuclease
MYYIYILYSVSSDLYYCGYTSNFQKRVIEHNEQENYNTFTSKHRPWVLSAIFEVSTIEAEAMRLEKFIKAQKSRKLIELLCQKDFLPSGKLVQLVRVPYLRD